MPQYPIMINLHYLKSIGMWLVKKFSPIQPFLVRIAGFSCWVSRLPLHHTKVFNSNIENIHLNLGH